VDDGGRDITRYQFAKNAAVWWGGVNKDRHCLSFNTKKVLAQKESASVEDIFVGVHTTRFFHGSCAEGAPCVN
jgi:hypothetical protein